MARERGLFNFSANFEVKKNAPLDTRTVVNTFLELTEFSTWADSDNKIWLYNGIVVSVTENHGLYVLTNYDPVTNPTAYSESENWIRVDATAAHIDVIDNLTTADTDKALSANQGKVLSEKIEEVKNSLSSVYNYRGSVSDFKSLPTDAVKGDVYNVTAANGNIPAGTNYAFDGENWDALGGSVDLSGYYTKTEVDSAIEEAKGAASTGLSELKKSVDANTAAILVVNGDETTEGSINHALKAATTYTDDQLKAYVAKEEGSSLIPDDKLTLIDTNATDITALKEAVEANTASINSNTSALQVLNGDVNTEGSVLNIVKNQITNTLEWQEVK